MNVRNCKKCGRIFNYAVGAPICPLCREQLEEKFKVVKEYIREHKDCTVQEVCRECNVERSQIQKWVREERLEFSNGIGAYCDKCGAPIPTGRFCEKCKVEMAGVFHDAVSQSESGSHHNSKDDGHKQKMRFLDR